MSAYLKNPIVLGVLAATLVYLYLYWEAERKYKNDKTVPKPKREPVKILIPGIVGVVIWFISSYYFDTGNDDDGKSDTNANDESMNAKIQSSSTCSDILGSSESVSANKYRLKQEGSGNFINATNPIDLVKPTSRIGKMKKITRLIDGSDSVNSNSYHLISKNKVRLPETDVFIDIAKF